MSDVTTEAVKLYVAKFGDGEIKPSPAVNLIKDDVTYDPNAGLGDPTVANATKAQRETATLPGRFWDHKGTTLFNPLPTDPRVEAILGERKYKQAISKNSPEEQILTIEQLKQQVELLTKLVGAKVEKEIEKPVEMVTSNPDYGNMPYAELLVEVKSMYPELRGRPKKEVILQMIADKESKKQ